MSAKILIVDDEPNVRLMYRAALEGSGYEIDEAESGEKALEQCVQRKHDVAILDLRMPGGMDGLKLLEEMHALDIQTPVVFITAFANVPDAVSAMKQGAIDFLQKPILPEQLRAIVKDVLVRHETEADQETPRDFDYFIRCAKRAINLQDFAVAKEHLIKALELNPDSPAALNLVGVMLEMREEYEQAKRYYGQAIKLNRHFEPAQQNMRRIYELFHFGSSKEPFNLENK
jgi:DNA-binding response OmpR family regulator